MANHEITGMSSFTEWMNDCYDFVDLPDTVCIVHLDIFAHTRRYSKLMAAPAFRSLACRPFDHHERNHSYLPIAPLWANYSTRLL